MEDKVKILEKLKEIIDPEIGFDIVSLGLVEDIRIENKKIKILLLPTNLFCPYLPYIVEMIESKLKEIGYESEVEIDFENVWNIERASEEIRKSLNFL